MDVCHPKTPTVSKDAAKASERIPSNADLEDGDAEPLTDRLDAPLGLRQGEVGPVYNPIMTYVWVVRHTGQHICCLNDHIRIERMIIATTHGSRGKRCNFDSMRSLRVAMIRCNFARRNTRLRRCPSITSGSTGSPSVADAWSALVFLVVLNAFEGDIVCPVGTKEASLNVEGVVVLGIVRTLLGVSHTCAKAKCVVIIARRP
jgi:hypothetical protein